MSREKLLKTVVEYIKRHKTYPTGPELKDLGYTRKTIDYHFGNITTLKALAYKQCTDVLFDLEQEQHNSAPRKSTKRFIITTAVLGSKVQKPFYKNIKKYCKDFNAELVVIPATENLSKTGWVLDTLLKEEVIITSDLTLNDNLFILGIKADAKTADPITGLPRIGQRNGTFISASPKQRLKYVPTSLDRLPHALMSTGAITLPGYTCSNVMTTKALYMANADHVMGAIIVELDKDNNFHFRQIQSDNEGSFIDIGNMYKDGKKSRVRPEAIVLGDWHSGSTDPKVVDCLIDLTNKIKPKRWIVHDLFDGISVNPHIFDKNITRANLLGFLNLGKDLDMVRSDLKLMSKLVDEVVVVRSNHDDFLDRYLESGFYVKEPQNHKLALQLALYKFDNKNPIEEYVGSIKNVSWLKLDESYKIAGIECGAHGHIGANGSSGSIGVMENAYGNVVYGHTHSPQILRGAWNVGTSTYLKLGYNKGSSSWVQTSCIIYPNGMRQLINFINGKYTTKDI